jgi:hypothetical protein
MPAIDRADPAVIKAKKMLKTLTLLLIFSLSCIEIPRVIGVRLPKSVVGQSRSFTSVGSTTNFVTSTRARELQPDYLFDECLDIADGAKDLVETQRARLRPRPRVTRKPFVPF